MMPQPSTIQQGRLHRYNRRLVAFEHAVNSNPKNVLLWIGGLGDSLLSVSYPSILAQNLPKDWTLAQVTLSSSLNGWGTGSVLRDAQELGDCVSYFRGHHRKADKIVLMGHSTGCQDAMEYISGKIKRPPLDGVILQAPVSDRETLEADLTCEARKKIIEVAQKYVSEERGDQVLPSSFDEGIYGNTLISAYRWLSLLSPDKRGDDDYFSSDLPDSILEQTFGKFSKTPLLILYSGKDEYVPRNIDIPGLIQKWSTIVERHGGKVDRDNGGIVEEAHHNLNQDNDKVVLDLCQRVQGFLSKIESGIYD
jgi:alpha-beta hydrolase superfamily lysophospholipase